MLNVLWRNMKWRFKNPVTIVMTILQPMIWLILYSTVAEQTMKGVDGGNYTAFIFPGIIVLVTFSSSGSSGIVNYIMKTRGSFYRIQISPIKRSSIVLGHFLEAIILSFFEVTVLCVLSLFFSVRVASGANGLLLMYILIFLIAFFISGISYSLSLKLPNEDIFQTVMNTIVLPIFFVSTALFPLENITGGFRIAVLINPFTHIINNLRKLIFESSIDFNRFFYTLGIFIILCFFSYALALRCLEKDRK
ncbi:MAG: ABC transporter permease [Eubacteriales bacterium]